jgi:hypothetical protein
VELFYYRDASSTHYYIVHLRILFANLADRLREPYNRNQIDSCAAFRAWSAIFSCAVEGTGGTIATIHVHGLWACRRTKCICRIAVELEDELMAPGQPPASDDQYPEAEIVRRRDEAIRRALNTPPRPNSYYIGKSERAKAQKRSRVSRLQMEKGQKQP